MILLNDSYKYVKSKVDVSVNEPLFGKLCCHRCYCAHTCRLDLYLYLDLLLLYNVFPIATREFNYIALYTKKGFLSFFSLFIY